KALRALNSVKKPKGGNFSARAANLQMQPCALVRCSRPEKDITMRLKSITLMVTLALALLTVPLAVDAQLPAKVHRVGRLITAFPPSQPNPILEAFEQTLRDLGYVEGRNIILEYRYAEGSEERLRDQAAELVQLPVDVIVAQGAAAIRAAQYATRTIPIVMAATSDPVGLGFVASLAQPGGNITGLSFLGEELPGKRLEILKEAVPQSTRIAVLANPALPAHASRMHNLTMAARALGLHLHVVEVRRADELDSAFAAMTQAGVDAVLL